MSWIKEIKYEDAGSRLKKLYDRVKGPDNYIDNILSVHSLRPHTLSGHMTLYKNVLHHSGNTLPKWYLEALGVYVSLLNRCEYCVNHHFAGFKRLIEKEPAKEGIICSFTDHQSENAFVGRYLQGLLYAELLTHQASKIDRQIIQNLRDSGFSDGEILEINQVVAYFNYANRTVLGLGVNLAGDILGLSPNDNGDPDNWGHS